MGFHDFIADRKTQSVSVLFVRYKWMENIIHLVLCNAVSCIRNLDFYLAAVAEYLDRNLAGIRINSFRRITDQIVPDNIP